MADSVHDEVVRVSLDDQKFIAGMNNIGKKTKAMFRQINADFNTLSMSGDWVGAYDSKVNGLKKLLSGIGDEVDELRTKLSRMKTTDPGYDKIATDLSKARMEQTRYADSLAKAQMGLTRAKTGVMDLRQNTQLLARETQASVSVFEAQGKQYSANAVKVSGYGKQLQALGSQYKAEQTYLKQIGASLGESSNEYREQATVVKETESRMRELSAAQQTAYKTVGNASLGYTQAADRVHSFAVRNVEAGRAMTNAGNNMMITSYAIGRAFVSAGKSAMDLEQAYRENTNLIKSNAQSEIIAAQTALAHAKSDDERTAAKKRITAAEYEASHAQESSNAMMQQGRSLSLQYGESQQNIANGYQELVKAGFSAKASMGSMESILQTSRATGEDFNRVLDVTVQTMNQYASSFPKTMGYQERAARTNNILAAAANATSTGYSELGEAMAQVGPVMSELGFTMSDTAAIVGVLSNRGIDGAQAGNNLKRAWLQLTSGSKPTQEAIEDLGLKIYDASGKTRNMADIMEDLQGKMKGMSQGDKEIIMKKLFGAYARTAGSIMLDNASSIREVAAATKEAGDSGDYVANLAKKNMDTTKAQIDRFKAAVTELGMSFVREMLPTIQNVVEGATNLVDAFGKLSPGMKQFIAYSLAATAAAGPLLSVFGTMRTVIGGTALGVDKTILAIGKLSGGFRAGSAGAGTYSKGVNLASGATGKLGVAMSALGPTGGWLSQNMERAGVSMTKVESGTVRAGGAMGKFKGFARGAAGAASSLLGVPLSPWVLGVGAAVGVGAAIWQLWGKNALESADRTSRWGTDVGKAADSSLNKMSEFSGNATVALETWSSKSSKSADTVATSFAQMYDRINKDATASNKKIDKQLSQLPASVASAISKAADQTKKSNTATAAAAKQTADNVAKITKQASNERRKLTDDEKTYIVNSQKQMGEQEVSVLQLSGKQKKTVLAALNGEVNKMTAKQRQQGIYDLEMSARKEAVTYNKQKKTIQDMYKSGEISQSAYKKGLNELADVHQDKVDTMALATYKLGKANHESKDEINQDLLLVGSSYAKVAAQIKKQSDAAGKSTGIMVRKTDEMSKSASKAADHWNSLVLDPKTGEVKTNAQEEINKAAQSEKGWEQLKYDLKHAKLSSNAKEMVATAALSSGRWNSLTWAEQKALIRTNAAETTIDIMKASGTWNKLTWQQQEAIVNSNSKGEVAAAMIDNGHWNDLMWEQQKALIQTNAGTTVVEALKAKGVWDGMDLEAKKAILSSNSKKEIAQALFDSQQWNNLDFKQQEALVTNKASKPVMEALNDAGKWADLSLDAKQAIVQAKGKEELADAITKFQLWNTLPSKEQIAAIKTKGGQELATTLDQLGFWNKLDPDEKNAVAHAKGKEELFDAIGGLQSWNNMNPEQKQAVVHEVGSEAVAKSLSNLNNWQAMTPQQKTATVQALGNPQMLEMIGGINTFNGLDPKTQQAVAVAIGNGDITALTNSMNQWTGLTPAQQWAIANTQGSDKVWAAIGTFQNWNSLPQEVKTSIGKQIGKGDVQGAINTFKNWNSLAQNHKTANSHQSGKNVVEGSINTFRTWNGLSQRQKTAISKQVGKGNVDAAVRSIQNFGAQQNHHKSMTTDVVKNFISNFITHGHKAGGTSNFEGGNVWLGDGGRHEPYMMPSGQLGVSGSDWEMHALPPGTKVWPSISAFNNTSGMKISAQQAQALRFASGGTVPDTIPKTRLVSQIEQTSRVRTPATNSEDGGLAQVAVLTSQVNELTKMLGSLVATISADNKKQVVIYQDNREVARGIAPYVTKEQEKMNSNQNRLRGIR